MNYTSRKLDNISLKYQVVRCSKLGGTYRIFTGLKNHPLLKAWFESPISGSRRKRETMRNQAAKYLWKQVKQTVGRPTTTFRLSLALMKQQVRLHESSHEVFCIAVVFMHSLNTFTPTWVRCPLRNVDTTASNRLKQAARTWVVRLMAFRFEFEPAITIMFAIFTQIPLQQVPKSIQMWFGMHWK